MLSEVRTPLAQALVWGNREMWGNRQGVTPPKDLKNRPVGRSNNLRKLKVFAHLGSWGAPPRTPDAQRTMVSNVFGPSSRGDCEVLRRRHPLAVAGISLLSVPSFLCGIRYRRDHHGCRPARRHQVSSQSSPFHPIPAGSGLPRTRRLAEPGLARVI